MDWLTFAADIIKSLAWPGVVLGVLFLFRSKLTALLDRLKTMEVEVAGQKFKAGLQEVEEKGLPTPEGKEITALPRPEKIEIRSELSKLPPAYVVSHAWLRLLETLYEAVETVQPGAGIGGNRNLLAYLDQARLHVLLLPDEEPIVQELLVLRNQAVLSPDSITSTDALRYYDFAEALKDNIKERTEQAKARATGSTGGSSPSLATRPP
jgi:hypothetical protein